MAAGSRHDDQHMPWSHSGSHDTPASTSELAGEAGSATDLTAHPQNARHGKQSKSSSKGKGKAAAGKGRDGGPEQWDPRRPQAQKTILLSEWLQKQPKVKMIECRPVYVALKGCT